MELLTWIGQAAKRQSDFIDRAQRLAESFSSLDELEEEMENRAAALTRKLKNEKITQKRQKKAGKRCPHVHFQENGVVPKSRRLITLLFPLFSGRLRLLTEPLLIVYNIYTHMCVHARVNGQMHNDTFITRLWSSNKTVLTHIIHTHKWTGQTHLSSRIH